MKDSLQIILKTYSVNIKDVQSPSRKHPLPEVRRMISYVLSKKLTQEAISIIINRNRSMVCIGINLMASHISTYTTVAKKYEDIMSRIDPTGKLSILQSKRDDLECILLNATPDIRYEKFKQIITMKTKQTIKMKTPISYYGGKQSMLKHILPLIPKHKVYVEPFFGGGAVFWSKEQSQVEVINDFNGNVINFYEQLKLNFKELKALIDATPYSREAYKRAMVIYNTPFLFSPVHRAWAFWMGCIQGFSNKIGSWRASQVRTKENLLNHNKKALFIEEYSKRLDLVQMEHRDAVYLIKRLDTPDTFFYIDPPYVDTNQGHYGGYTQEHFNNLLEVLSNIKGKFLLSSYPNTVLNDYRVKYNWFTSDKNMALSASKGSNKRKTEALTFNYEA